MNYSVYSPLRYRCAILPNFKELTLFMKIIFSKNNYYFERNEGIEPTTSNWNVRILPSELIPHLVPETGLGPVQAFSPRDFLTTTTFVANNVFYRSKLMSHIMYPCIVAQMRLYCSWSGLYLHHIETRPYSSLIEQPAVRYRNLLRSCYYYTFNLGAPCIVSTHCL